MHKKDKKKVLNILFIPDNQEAPPKSVRIRYITLGILAAVVTIFLVSVLVGLVTYSQVLQAALEKEEREKELLELRQQLKLSYQLQSELDTIRAYKEKVRSSLQGYVKFAEKGEPETFFSDKLIDGNYHQTSIFNNIPLQIPVTGFVSQEYNWPNHTGIDIVAPEGTPIQAAGSGTVLVSGWTYDSGYIVVIYHKGGYITHYRHNSRNLVAVNQNVSQGEVIAFLGNSGESSSGPHLHFEIWKDGQPFNPRIFLTELNNLGE